MKSRIFLIGAIILLTLAASAWAADIAGKWVAEAPGGQQGNSEITLTFKVEGTNLTGTLDNSQMPGPIEIKEGKIKDNEISFYLMRKIGENEMKVIWKGKISGDEIRFTRETEGGMTGGGAGGPGGGAGAGAGGGAASSPEIIAKRAK